MKAQEIYIFYLSHTYQRTLYKRDFMFLVPVQGESTSSKIHTTTNSESQYDFVSVPRIMLQVVDNEQITAC